MISYKWIKKVPDLSLSCQSPGAWRPPLQFQDGFASRNGSQAPARNAIQNKQTHLLKDLSDIKQAMLKDP